MATDRGNISWHTYDPVSKKTSRKIEFTGHMDECRSVLTHPTKKILASTGRDGSVRLWDCSNENKPTLLNNLTLHDEKVSEAAFIGDWIVTASWDQRVGLWRLPDFLKI